MVWVDPQLGAVNQLDQEGVTGMEDAMEQSTACGVNWSLLISGHEEVVEYNPFK